MLSYIMMFSMKKCGARFIIDKINLPKCYCHNKNCSVSLGSPRCSRISLAFALSLTILPPIASITFCQVTGDDWVVIQESITFVSLTVSLSLFCLKPCKVLWDTFRAVPISNHLLLILANRSTNRLKSRRLLNKIAKINRHKILTYDYIWINFHHVHNIVIVCMNCIVCNYTCCRLIQ